VLWGGVGLIFGSIAEWGAGSRRTAASSAH
jgi:hypothetical protein